MKKLFQSFLYQLTYSIIIKKHHTKMNIGENFPIKVENDSYFSFEIDEVNQISLHF
jgi:hypothetical protein